MKKIGNNNAFEEIKHTDNMEMNIGLHVNCKKY